MSARAVASFPEKVNRWAYNKRVRKMAKDRPTRTAEGMPIIYIDEDLDNADWTKRTWDLPKWGTPEFDDFLAHSGMTLEAFKKLPVYKWAVERGDIKE